MDLDKLNELLSEASDLIANDKNLGFPKDSVEQLALEDLEATDTWWDAILEKEGHFLGPASVVGLNTVAFPRPLLEDIEGHNDDEEDWYCAVCDGHNTTSTISFYSMYNYKLGVLYEFVDYEKYRGLSDYLREEYDAAG